MDNTYYVRRFQTSDADEVSALIIKTLRTINIKDYSAEYIENLVNNMSLRLISPVFKYVP